MTNNDKGAQGELACEENSQAVGRNKLSYATIFKFVGLIAFFIIIFIVIVLMWPLFQGIFDENGIENIVTQIREAGVVGMLILLGLQFLQIVVAFIPGEVVQVAAGILYGPWIGALLILIGCVFSSWFIYQIVHRLGAPFVQEIVPMKYMEKFRAFEKSGKLDVVVFILFLIPGLPKDTFTYLVPLTDMECGRFLFLSNVGRIPGVLMSTIAASGLMEGNYVMSIALFAVAAIIALCALIFKDKLLSLFERFSAKKVD